MPPSENFQREIVWIAEPPSLSDLLAALPREQVITDPAELFVYEADGFTIAKARPAAVVFRSTVEHSRDRCRSADETDAQIVPRGSGTGSPADAWRLIWA